MIQTLCYCGTLQPFEKCCAPLLSGKQRAKTPEQLMRSRYSAFCTENMEYLLDTCHPSQRKPDDRDTLAGTMAHTQWLGLKILKIEDEPVNKEIGYVEFIAFYNAGDMGQLHENSKFVRENDQWFYFNGVLLDPVTFGRNEPCWCNSGKKYKKCHGKM